MTTHEPTRTDAKRLKAILDRSADPESSWLSALAYAKTRLSANLQEVAVQDFATAIVGASERVAWIRSVEPLPQDVEFYYFGLYDAGFPGEDGILAGYYFSGGQPFDPEDLSCIENITYFPEHRLIRSDLLDGLKRFSERNRATSTLTDYLLGLPAACLLTRGVLKTLGDATPTLVGFDEGDFFWVQ